MSDVKGAVRKLKRLRKERSDSFVEGDEGLAVWTAYTTDIQKCIRDHAEAICDALLAAHDPTHQAREAALVQAAMVLVEHCKGRVPHDSSDSIRGNVEAVHVLRLSAALAAYGEQ